MVKITQGYTEITLFVTLLANNYIHIHPPIEGVYVSMFRSVCNAA